MQGFNATRFAVVLVAGVAGGAAGFMLASGTKREKALTAACAAMSTFAFARTVQTFFPET